MKLSEAPVGEYTVVRVLWGQGGPDFGGKQGISGANLPRFGSNWAASGADRLHFGPNGRDFGGGTTKSAPHGANFSPNRPNTVSNRPDIAQIRPDGGRGERIARRLRVLGVFPGAAITLTQIAAGDVRVLSVRGMRLALGRQIAARITVTPR